jgi:uncharacterized protein (DUF1697 family)
VKYIALLRGINVGGNSIIKMYDLKAAVEKCGFSNVKTVIQSGNVIFESNESIDKATLKMEKALSENFGVSSGMIIKTHDQFKEVLAGIPDAWKKADDLRMYIAFVIGPVTVQEVLAEIEPKEGVDFVETGPGVLYMSTRLSGITKSRFSKLVAKKIYKSISIRNYNTVKKLLAFMESR